MIIEELVTMAERIHDAEGFDLGAASTRESRNAFWMRVIGCAHFGHPVYNPAPDASWHVKDAGGGRPMSDDTAVHLPSREAWDCIPGAGAGSYDPHQFNRDEHGVRVPGYRFEAHALGVLPAAQHVYPPSSPSGSGPAPTPAPPKPTVTYPDEPTFWLAFQDRMRKAYSDKGRAFPDPNDADAFRRFSRCGFDIGQGMDPQRAADKHIAELRQELGV